ncbi:MAG: DUF1987 domain-containing protein [Proteobacteria bacterium]|nr:DUF1987 domain-containing protein [Pseudomonadota bacterium]
MDDLKIEPTKFTPEITFDYNHRLLEIKGESYPENTSEFFNPVFKWLEDYLAGDHDETTVVNIELYYFNSSSSKVLMNFLEVLDQASAKGKNITVNWVYEEEDEDSLEFGEEFAEDLNHVTFNLKAKE